MNTTSIHIEEYARIRIDLYLSWPLTSKWVPFNSLISGKTWNQRKSIIFLYFKRRTIHSLNLFDGWIAIKSDTYLMETIQSYWTKLCYYKTNQHNWRILEDIFKIKIKNGDKFKSIDMHGDNRHLRRDVQANTHKQVRTRYGYDTSLQYWYLYIPCQINAKDNMHVLI